MLKCKPEVSGVDVLKCKPEVSGVDVLKYNMNEKCQVNEIKRVVSFRETSVTVSL